MPEIEMRPQILNAVVVLIVSLAVAAGTLQLEVAEAGPEVPYEAFLWGALALAMIVSRDFLSADPTKPRSALLGFLTFLVVGNVVVGLVGFRQVRALPELLRDTEENALSAVFLFALSALVLFAKDLPAAQAESVTGRPGRVLGGLPYMLLMSVPAWVLARVLCHVLGYPDVLSAGGTFFVASLAVVMLTREGVLIRRRLRGAKTAVDRLGPAGGGA